MLHSCIVIFTNTNKIFFLKKIYPRNIDQFKGTIVRWGELLLHIAVHNAMFLDINECLVHKGSDLTALCHLPESWISFKDLMNSSWLFLAAAKSFLVVAHEWEMLSSGSRQEGRQLAGCEPMFACSYRNLGYLPLHPWTTQTAEINCIYILNL